jgi:hypothetical protein
MKTINVQCLDEDKFRVFDESILKSPILMGVNKAIIEKSIGCGGTTSCMLNKGKINILVEPRNSIGTQKIKKHDCDDRFLICMSGGIKDHKVELCQLIKDFLYNKCSCKKTYAIFVCYDSLINLMNFIGSLGDDLKLDKSMMRIYLDEYHLIHPIYLGDRLVMKFIYKLITEGYSIFPMSGSEIKDEVISKLIDIKFHMEITNPIKSDINLFELSDDNSNKLIAEFLINKKFKGLTAVYVTQVTDTVGVMKRIKESYEDYKFYLFVGDTRKSEGTQQNDESRYKELIQNGEFHYISEYEEVLSELKSPNVFVFFNSSADIGYDINTNFDNIVITINHYAQYILTPTSLSQLCGRFRSNECTHEVNLLISSKLGEMKEIKIPTEADLDAIGSLIKTASRYDKNFNIESIMQGITEESWRQMPFVVKLDPYDKSKDSVIFNTSYLNESKIKYDVYKHLLTEGIDYYVNLLRDSNLFNKVINRTEEYELSKRKRLEDEIIESVTIKSSKLINNSPYCKFGSNEYRLPNKSKWVSILRSINSDLILVKDGIKYSHVNVFNFVALNGYLLNEDINFIKSKLVDFILGK